MNFARWILALTSVVASVGCSTYDNDRGDALVQVKADFSLLEAGLALDSGSFVGKVSLQTESGAVISLQNGESTMVPKSLVVTRVKLESLNINGFDFQTQSLEWGLPGGGSSARADGNNGIDNIEAYVSLNPISGVASEFVAGADMVFSFTANVKKLENCGIFGDGCKGTYKPLKPLSEIDAVVVGSAANMPVAWAQVLSAEQIDDKYVRVSYQVTCDNCAYIYHAGFNSTDFGSRIYEQDVLISGDTDGTVSVPLEGLELVVLADDGISQTTVKYQGSLVLTRGSSEGF